VQQPPCESPLTIIATEAVNVGAQVGLLGRVLIVVRLAIAAMTGNVGLLVTAFLILVPVITSIVGFMKGGAGAVLGFEAALVALFAAVALFRGPTGTLALFKKGIGGLVSSFIGLASAHPVALILGIVFAIQQLAEHNVLGLGDFFNNLIRDTDEARAHIEDLKAEAGKFGDALGNVIDGAVNDMGRWDAKIREARDNYQKTIDSGGIGQNSNAIIAAEKLVEDALEGQAKAGEAAFQMIKTNADKAGVSMETYAKSVLQWLPLVNNNFADAESAASDYFGALGEDGAITIKKAVKLWNDLISQGIKPTIKPEDFIKQFVSKANIQQAVNDLDAQLSIAKARLQMNQKGFLDPILAADISRIKLHSSEYSADIVDQVDSILKGIPDSVRDIVTESTAIMDKGAGEIFSGLTGALKAIGFERVYKKTITVQGKVKWVFSGLKNVGEELKKAYDEAQAGTVTPSQFAEIILGKTTLGSVEAGFLSKHLGMREWATTQVETLKTDFNTAVASAIDSGQTGNLATGIINNFKAQFPKGFKDPAFKKLDPDLQSAIQGWVDWAYTQFGLTSPSASVTGTVSTAITKKLPAWLAAEFRDAKSDGGDPSSAAAKAIQQAVTGMKVVWDDTKNGGKKTVWDMHDDITEAFRINIFAKQANPITTAVTGMRLAWQGEGGGKSFLTVANSDVASAFHLDLTSGGHKVIESWITGAKNAWHDDGLPIFHRTLSWMANRMVGNSPPKLGPLKDIDKGGYNIMKAWTGGLDMGGKEALKSAADTTTGISAALSAQQTMLAKGAAVESPTMEFNASNTRVIKVQLEVSSKDGSIDGLNMKVLGDTLRPELIRELEHMAATV
jgi:citrate lyase gamma subunit